MPVPRFVQISAVKLGQSGYCYALDGDGRVWCHGKWYDSDTLKYKGTYWQPLETEGPPSPPPPSVEEIAAREVEELLK